MTGTFFSATVPVQEVETFSKPGTADVTAGDRKKLAGLLKHYRAQAHPFTACKRDQMKHGLEEDHANRRCAVLKDLIEGTTKWRGKSKEAEVALDIVAEALQIVQLAATGLGGRGMSELLREGALRESERGRVAVGMGSLEELDRETAAALEELAIAAAVVEAAPRWMLPVAATRPGFRPVKPEKKTKSTTSTSTNSEFNRLHPRGTGAQGGKFIRKGSSGTEVSALQRRLRITEDGSFGGQTKRRVERFQKNHGLQVDGVVGAQTIAALRSNGSNASVAPGALTRNDRRYLRRLSSRTGASTSSPGTTRRTSTPKAKYGPPTPPKLGPPAPTGGGRSSGSGPKSSIIHSPGTTRRTSRPKRVGRYSRGGVVI